MITFKTTKEAIEYLKAKDYAPLDMENATGYQPTTWKEVEGILLSGQDMHATIGEIGDWEYFNLEREIY